MMLLSIYVLTSIAITNIAHAGELKLLYTSEVSGHIFEVDGDGRTCTRFWNNGSLITNIGNVDPLHSCAGGAAGRKHFVDKYYAANNNHGNVIMLDTGNHFYGSREYFVHGASGIAAFSKKLNYDAMALNRKDLNAEQTEIQEFISSMNSGGSTVPFIASNLILNPLASKIPSKQRELYSMIKSKKIKSWHVIPSSNSNDKTVVFALLPKDAVVRSRCTVTSDKNAGVLILGQNSPDDEWLMSQVSHMNRLWEEVKAVHNSSIDYAILLGDLPMEQLITLTRVLSFINVGIGPNAPTKKTGVCNPNTMNAINCAPLNGQPIYVQSEIGIARDIPNAVDSKSDSFFLSYNSAPIDVPMYTNATYITTRNGRSIGVFQHDLSVATNLNLKKPWGNVYVVNNQLWETPNELLHVSGGSSSHTNIEQSWLNKYDFHENKKMTELSAAIGKIEKYEKKNNPQGSVSQPVYGELLGTQLYKGNRFREVGCSQVDCPLGRLFLDSMLAVSYKEGLCKDAIKKNDGNNRKNEDDPWCVAIINGESLSTSLSSYGQSWRDGKDQYDQMGLRPPDEDHEKEIIKDVEEKEEEEEKYKKYREKKREDLDHTDSETGGEDDSASVTPAIRRTLFMNNGPTSDVSKKEEFHIKRGLAPVESAADATGATGGDDEHTTHTPPKGSPKVDDMNIKKTSKGFKEIPSFVDAPPSYVLSENDLRASYPYSIDKNTGQPRKSDQLYYIDFYIHEFKKYFINSLQKWNYQTKNFGTFISSSTSAPYHLSWRIRRTASQWPMVDEVPTNQKVRLIGTYHDLTLGPYWDGHAANNNGIGPVINIMNASAQPIVFNHDGNNTASHAVGNFLKHKYYNFIGPWTNAFESKQDQKYLIGKLQELPSYIFDDTVNCTKVNHHDALLGDYCNVVVYDETKIPFVTPGRQNIYVAYPNTTYLSNVAYEHIRVVEKATQEFIERRGSLAKTDVSFHTTDGLENDGGFSSFKDEIIKNDNKIGTAPPAVLGPLTSQSRINLKLASRGLSDKFIQLRYDHSAENAVDIIREDGGDTLFFGNTRKDRAYALRRTMVHQNWTAATIIHQSSYDNNAGISCSTLLKQFGCSCDRATSTSPTIINSDYEEENRRFWCINAEHSNYLGYDNNNNPKVHSIFETLNDNSFYSTEVESNLFAGRFNSSSAVVVPNVIVLAIRNMTILEPILNISKELGMLSRYSKNEEKEYEKKVEKKKDDEKKKPRNRRERRMNTISLDLLKDKYDVKNPKVWIVYESEMLKDITPFLPTNYDNEGCWMLGLGRLSIPNGEDDENGKIEATSDEHVINSYEASIGYLYGLGGVYDLLLALDQKKRKNKLKYSDSVHSSLAELIKIQLRARPLSGDNTGLFNNIQWGHPSYGRRCSVFDVIVLNEKNHMNYHGTMIHNCMYAIFNFYLVF
jgi:hypothetical protein